MPRFDTMAQAAASTGVPISALRLAKAEGCEAFRHGRVDFGLFIRWWFQSQLDNESVNWAEDLKKSQALRERIRLSEDQGRTVDRDEVVFVVNKGVSTLASMLDRKFKLEGPPALKGRDESFILQWLTQTLEESYAGLKADLEKLEVK